MSFLSDYMVSGASFPLILMPPKRYDVKAPPPVSYILGAYLLCHSSCMEYIVCYTHGMVYYRVYFSSLVKTMENGELVFPSFIAPAPASNTVVRALPYMPSLNCCLFLVNDSALPLQVLYLNTRSVVQRLAVEEVQDFSDVVALSSDRMLLASGVQSENNLVTEVRLSQLEGTFSECVGLVHSCCIYPGFSKDTIACIRFFPDGEKIVVTIYRRQDCRRGAWLRMYVVPDNFWFKKIEIREDDVQESVSCDEEKAQDGREENDEVQNISEQTDGKDSFGSRGENLSQGDDSFHSDNRKEAEETELENNVNKDNGSSCVSDKRRC